jgi:hypothetical protein
MSLLIQLNHGSEVLPKIRKFRLSEIIAQVSSFIFNVLNMVRRLHSGNAMALKIVKKSDGARTVFKLSGRIRSGDIEGLRGQMDAHAGGIALDLEEVTLVDVEVVRFLGMCERKGVELVRCSPYIREWVFREQAADDEI